MTAKIYTCVTTFLTDHCKRLVWKELILHDKQDIHFHLSIGFKSFQMKPRSEQKGQIFLTPRDTFKLCATVNSYRNHPFYEIHAVFNEMREEPVFMRLCRENCMKMGNKSVL